MAKTNLNILGNFVDIRELRWSAPLWKGSIFTAHLPPRIQSILLVHGQQWNGTVRSWLHKAKLWEPLQLLFGVDLKLCVIEIWFSFLQTSSWKHLDFQAYEKEIQESYVRKNTYLKTNVPSQPFPRIKFVLNNILPTLVEPSGNSSAIAVTVPGPELIPEKPLLDDCLNSRTWKHNIDLKLRIIRNITECFSS